jgi:hypothetical protein
MTSAAWDDFFVSSEWKSQSAMRVLELWSKFLEMPGSAQDPSYDSVLDVSTCPCCVLKFGR